ncbi:siroheme synthase CysG [Jiella sp. MQZ9-1]|uniref:Uroporphyrinogen-III C-methyltransferase n=2 Tax=Jiella flava TaxID=2816857 RepID=A0A939JR84_9HYPH|nr:siroheme synthase CysG [Jiella flava]MBO0661653.1 uroporphyrinogen-III C-methyltransferase [Jiella flava]MCD2470295.1 siroheme synthase CysG [Jiella flava]
MGALSVLPVFVSLHGRPVLLAGGSAAAAWKAEMLAAAGACVELYVPAAERDPEMQALLAELGTSETPRAGEIRHHDRAWAIDLFATRPALAILDTESEAEGQAFASAARAASVPVNVVDKPAFCDFAFGSIVNRSPVVVGISTFGAAPILGQAIRRRIETLLPPALSDWAALAAKLRTAAMEKLAPGLERRAFWERFADKAFLTRAPEAADDAEATRLIDAIASAPKAAVEGTAIGKVTLVGAGPGEAELLTLKAVRALQAADVILFDDLVSDSVLELARREAKRMLVGKRAARESCRQEDINALMIQFAKAGKSVVRLKSGDVSVFGRAGEELRELKAEGIPVAIVPGITAASALAAAFNVSLTHRDHAQELRFVTGHSKKGGLPENVDWAALAKPNATTIFYMGGRMAEKIASRLIAEGLSPAIPVGVAANLSREDETRAAGRLDDLGAIVGAIGFDRPILIGVGAVFGEAAAKAASHDGAADAAVATLRAS